DILNKLDINEKQSNVLTKYMKIFANNDFKNLLLIIESVMAIPIGNDFVERVFSHLRRIWTNERSLMSVELIKAEICIKNNFNMNCNKFKSFVKDDKNLLKSVKSNQNYL